MDEVRLPDLEVIRRYSIAVRREHAPVEDVLEALRADLETLEAATRPSRPATRRTAGRKPAAKPARRTTR